MREVTDCVPAVLRRRKTVLRPTLIMRAVARHPTPFMAISSIFWCTGLRSGVSELVAAMFYGSESRDSAGVRQLSLRTTPSVAEQEGQLIETEATGAPKTIFHHTPISYTSPPCALAGDLVRPGIILHGASPSGQWRDAHTNKPDDAE